LQAGTKDLFAEDKKKAGPVRQIVEGRVDETVSSSGRRKETCDSILKVWKKRSLGGKGGKMIEGALQPEGKKKKGPMARLV